MGHHRPVRGHRSESQHRAWLALLSLCVQPLVCQRRSLVRAWNATSPQGTGQACVAVSNPPHPEAVLCCGRAVASRPRPLPRWLCQLGPHVSLLKTGSLRPSMDTCSPRAARGISVTPVSVPKLSRSECPGVSVARTMEPPCGDCGRTQRGTAARGAGGATEPRSPRLTHAWGGSSSSAMYGSVLRSSAARGRGPPCSLLQRPHRRGDDRRLLFSVSPARVATAWSTSAPMWPVAGFTQQVGGPRRPLSARQSLVEWTGRVPAATKRTSWCVVRMCDEQNARLADKSPRQGPSSLADGRRAPGAGLGTLH